MSDAGELDRRSGYIAELLDVVRRNIGRPTALVCHPTRAGMIAPYAAMFDVDLVLDEQVPLDELRARGESGDEIGDVAEPWES